MKNKFLMWTAGLLAALIVVGALGATAVYADDSTPPATTSADPLWGGRGPRGERGLPTAELEAAAKVLGMTSDELSTALKDGKTLQDLATAAGLDVKDVQEAINTVHRAEMRTRIEQAVTDGTMTQAKADWLLEGLDKGYLDGPGFGFGFGGGRHGGFGGPLPDGTTPSATIVAPTATP